MKKIFTLILAMILCLSFVACESDETSEDSDDEAKAENFVDTATYNVGNTVHTDIAEFTLISVTEKKAADGNKDNSYQFVFSIKNISNTTLNGSVASFMDGQGSSNAIEKFIQLVYDDGYYYACGICFEETKDGQIESPRLNIEPSAPAVQYTATINVPAEVLTDTQSSLQLKVALPRGNDSTGFFTYQIR